MSITWITAIKGGHELPFDPHPGCIWVAPIGCQIAVIPGQEVELFVDGYPDERRENEPDTLVTISMFRMPARLLLLQLVVRLSTLKERPSLVTRLE